MSDAAKEARRLAGAIHDECEEHGHPIKAAESRHAADSEVWMQERETRAAEHRIFVELQESA